MPVRTSSLAATALGTGVVDTRRMRSSGGAVPQSPSERLVSALEDGRDDDLEADVVRLLKENDCSSPRARRRAATQPRGACLDARRCDGVLARTGPADPPLHIGLNSRRHRRGSVKKPFCVRARVCICLWRCAVLHLRWAGVRTSVGMRCSARMCVHPSMHERGSTVPHATVPAGVHAHGVTGVHCGA